MNVVLTRLDRVGDLILSTPAIASVRASWPDAHVTLVCSSYNAIVVRKNRDIDALAILPTGVRPGSYGKRYRGACDVAIALAPCAPDFALVGATRAPVRVGYTYVRRYLARLTAPLFLTRLAVSEADPALSDRHPAYRVRHEVDQVLELVRLAGGTVERPELVVPIDDDDRAAVAAVPAGAIAFHLGARWFLEGSTRESTFALIGDLRRFGLPLVVTYGLDTAAEAQMLEATGLADLVVGNLTFAQWAATFEKSRVVVTVDTGATHVASATRRPTVVLFEHRHFHLSSQEWSPYRVRSVCLRKPASETADALGAMRAEIVAAVDRLVRAP